MTNVATIFGYLDLLEPRGKTRGEHCVLFCMLRQEEGFQSIGLIACPFFPMSICKFLPQKNISRHRKMLLQLSLQLADTLKVS